MSLISSYFQKKKSINDEDNYEIPILFITSDLKLKEEIEDLIFNMVMTGNDEQHGDNNNNNNNNNNSILMKTLVMKIGIRNIFFAIIDESEMNFLSQNQIDFSIDELQNEKSNFMKPSIIIQTMDTSTSILEKRLKKILVKEKWIGTDLMIHFDLPLWKTKIVPPSVRTVYDDKIISEKDSSKENLSKKKKPLNLQA